MQISDPTLGNNEQIATILPTNTEPRSERFQRFFRENVTGAFTEKERLQNETHVARFCDTFLRHLSPFERVEKAEDINSTMVSFVNWEKQQGRGQVGRWIGGQVMQIDRTDNVYDVIAHESMHVLQNNGTLPPNHPITYSINELLLAQRGSIPVYPSESSEFAAIKSEYKSKSANDYFNEVLSGGKNLPKWFWGGWRLDLSDERYQNIDPRDTSLRDFKRFLEIEKEIEPEILAWGEVSLDIMGVKDVYTTIANIGTSRGLRAFGVGHFTGDPKNAWTVLWLNATGMKFEDAERLVVQKYLDGTLSDFDIKNPIEGKDFKRIKTGEEIYKTRKLDQSPIERTANKYKFQIEQYLRLVKRSFRQLPQEELDNRYSLFSEWISSNKVKDTETSEVFLVMDEITNQMDFELKESVEDKVEKSGKIFASHDRSGTRRKLSIPKVIPGKEFSTNPPEFETVLTEEVGIFHTHIYHGSPPSIIDLLNFIDAPDKFISVMATPEKDYVFVKTDKECIDRNNNNNKGSKFRNRVGLAKSYMQRLYKGEDSEKVIIEMAKLEGMEVFIKNKPSISRLRQSNLGIIQFKKV